MLKDNEKRAKESGNGKQQPNKFHSCCLCCIQPKTGSLLVGCINVIIGGLGLFTMYTDGTRTKENIDILHEEASDDSTSFLRNAKIQQDLDYLTQYYWSVLLAFAFPSVLTLLTGLFVILATAKTNEYIILISVLLTAILDVVSLSIGGILYFVLHAETSLWMPICLWGVIQLYFIMVLMDFRTRNSKKETGKHVRV